MRFWNHSKPLYLQKKVTVPVIVISLLLMARMILVPIVHKKLNKFLDEFSPTYAFHIDDLDISIIRGAYSFQGVSGKLKRNQRKFVDIDAVDVSIAWRELFKGRILTDIAIERMDFHYLSEVTKAAKTEDQDHAKSAKNTLFPVKIERIVITDSVVTLEELPSLKEGARLQLTGIEGRVTNLTPSEKLALSFFNINGTFMGSSKIKTVGHLNMTKKPLSWDVDGEVHSFDLTSLNQFLKRKLPLTFTTGKLDLYAEAKSEGGKIVGYVKPFLKNIDIMTSSEDLKGPKHWFIEALTAVGNLILRTSDTKTLATRVPFVYDGAFHIGTGEAISKAIENGFVQKLSPGIEDKFELK